MKFVGRPVLLTGGAWAVSSFWCIWTSRAYQATVSRPPRSVALSRTAPPSQSRSSGVKEVSEVNNPSPARWSPDVPSSRMRMRLLSRNAMMRYTRDSSRSLSRSVMRARMRNGSAGAGGSTVSVVGVRSPHFSRKIGGGRPARALADLRLERLVPQDQVLLDVPDDHLHVVRGVDLVVPVVPVLARPPVDVRA